ncbi:MAG: sulfatase-like hydrolase/transferase [Planctomycetaceae bacterium]|nr:sulfatase-like hydrolase/transferase [Planctomycetaceae bacterium]
MKYLLSVIICCMAFAKPGCTAEDTSNPPNILFIYSDDQSYRTVGCYPDSYDFVRTPHIDQLARQGMRFDAAYIGTWCMPSRAAMLTGHHQYGIQSMRMEGEYPGSKYDPQQCPFWPSVFRQNGYVTAQIGKWHTGTDNGFGRDWDHQKVWNRPAFPANAGNYYDNQLIQIDGEEGKLVTGYSTDNYTDWAIDFIDGGHRDPDKPWYLWVCYGAVHGPFTPADRHQQDYPNVQIPIPEDIYPPRAGKPNWMQKIDQWEKGEDGQPVMAGNGFQARTVDTKGIHGNALNDWVRQYHQGVSAIDEGVGRIMEALDASGQRENTLVVFTSDQGFGWGQHGFRMKLAPYDATIRSPMIVSMPGRIPKRSVCKTPVAGVDIAPTFFSFAGINLPWKMHGHDISPLLNNPKTKWEHPVLQTLTGRSYGKDTDTIPSDPEIRDLNGVPWWVSLREGNYKYIRTLVVNEPEELYDLKHDPDELHNLAFDKNYRSLTRRLRAATIDELRRTDAKMVEHLPAVGTGY